MKGFQIFINSQQLLGAVTKVNVLKGEYILLEGTNRYQAKQSKAGIPFFRMAMRFSKTATNGASFVEADCNYMPYDAVVENEGTPDEKTSYTYLSDVSLENAKVVFDPAQLTELAKVYGDSNDMLVLDCATERKLCTVQNKASKGEVQRISSDITLPMIDKAIDSGLAGNEVFAEAVVTESTLRKISSESMSNSGAEEVNFCFGQKLEAFIADRKLLYTGEVKTVEYAKQCSEPKFYSIKAADFRSVIGVLDQDEKVKISLKGDTSPRYYEFTSENSGATYTLPVYKEPMDYKRMEAAMSALKTMNRNISVIFDRKDFAKAISLLSIGYKEENLRFALTDGDEVVIQQAKGEKKLNSISIKGAVKIKGRAKFGEHFDPAEGPVLVDFYAKAFSSILKGLGYKNEGDEKGVETVRLTILDCCTKFENVEAGEIKFLLNFLSNEQTAEFRAAQKALAQKAKETAAASPAPVQAPVTETPEETSSQPHPAPVTDVTPADEDDELEEKLA